jgi:hypothetical protein
MLALSIRQPYAELILRGIKTVECRGRSTRIIGDRFYIYASKAKAAKPIWSEDLLVATPPKWMIELAEQVGMIEPGALLPTGVIVGSAVIEKVTPPDAADPGGLFHWHLTDVQREEVSQASIASSAGLAQSFLSENPAGERSARPGLIRFRLKSRATIRWP